METCTTCGSERRRIGVLYPVRCLCSCEKEKCECGRTAVFVEFQGRVDSESEKNCPQKLFLCVEHRPVDFPWEEAQEPASSKKRRPKAKKNELPQIDPLWPSWAKPPAGVTSRDRVQCVGCKFVHEARERRMFNGTESYCPSCGERVWVHANLEEAA